MTERGVLQAISERCTGCNTAPPRYFSDYSTGTSGSFRHNTLRLSPRIFLYRVGVSVSAELRGRRLAWSGQRNVANRIPVRLLERGEPGALATLRTSLSRPDVASSNLAGPTTTHPTLAHDRRNILLSFWCAVP